MQVTPEMKKMREQGMTFAEIAKRIGKCRSVVNEAFSGRPGRTKPAIAVEQPKPGRSLSDFRKTYDKDLIVPNKIKTTLKLLGNSWCYEKEFVYQAGVSFGDLSNYRDMFAEHVVTIRQDNKRVWAGTVKLANELKGIVL